MARAALFVRSFALAGVTITLASCVTVPDPLGDRAAAMPSQERGYAIGTFAISCFVNREGNQCRPAFNSMTTWYRPLDGSADTGRFRFQHGGIPSDTVPDFVDLNRKETGFHFCIALPPGKYSVYSVGYYNYAGGGSGVSLPPGRQFDVPFVVAAGEVAYLGRLKQISGEAPNLLGINVNTLGPLLLSSDQGEMQAALKKCPPEIQSRPVRNAALNAALANGHAFVRPDSRN